jgi:hypothetical protein
MCGGGVRDQAERFGDHGPILHMSHENKLKRCERIPRKGSQT